MKVFISHTLSDEDKKLAEKLLSVLNESKIDGYVAVKNKKYDLLIRDKIRREIEDSDHLVAILTRNALESASVNQELGYALREGILPIIMLEKNAKQGVLTLGIDPEEFTKENFENSCRNVKDHILAKGIRQKLPREMSEITDKISLIEKHLSKSKIPSTALVDEDLWYNEIMQATENTNDMNQRNERRNAKNYYAKIKTLKNKLVDARKQYTIADSVFEQSRLSSDIKKSQNDIEFNMNMLSMIWSRIT